VAAAVQERSDAIEVANPTERVPITLPPARGPGAAPAMAVLGLFVVTLDALVVSVALPAIGHDLGGGITGQGGAEGFSEPLVLGALVANPSTFVSGLQVSLVMAAVLLLGTAVASLQVRPAPSR
jgi:DHA2 family methylenomycin A resistance protein-like MFS transporter